MTKRCENCAFWQPLSDDENAGYAADRNYDVVSDGAGICRRYPPAGPRPDAPAAKPVALTDAGDAALWAQWPVTSGDLDWCGEYARGPGLPF